MPRRPGLRRQPHRAATPAWRSVQKRGGLGCHIFGWTTPREFGYVRVLFKYPILHTVLHCSGYGEA